MPISGMPSVSAAVRSGPLHTKTTVGAGGTFAEHFVPDGAAGHRDRLEPVELPAQFMPFLPGENTGDGHRLEKGGAHAGHHDTTAGQIILGVRRLCYSACRG